MSTLTDLTTTGTKIILITGANKGVGLATAEVLARAGHTVLLGARDPGRGEAAVAAARVPVRFVRLDVTDPATIAAAAKLIEAGYGRLDVLINNAGISRDRPYQPGDVPVGAIREVYETNVIGVIAVTNAMLPLLRRSAAGYIGNVSSGLGTIALLTDHDSDWARYANLLGYNSSKAALNAVTLIYARSLAADGIRVNALSPGFVATDLNRHTGHLPAAQGGANIAEQILRDGTGTGQFLSETGGTHPW
jgi:NAD(P)-dependent dehydrogenase (short-subunit alcohol dehydrogenase family)